MARKGEIVGAVDLGSREIRVLIACKGRDGAIQVIGHGVSPARGCVSQGVIQDLGATQLALKRALTAAEKEANTRIHSLFCGINGKSVETFIREGNVKLEEGIVERRHLAEALDAASRDVLAPGKQVVSSITAQEWYVDDMRVKDPVGIRGSVLKARVHFAQIPSVIVVNISNCVISQGRELEDLVFLPLAAGLGCLTQEDIDLGAVVIDMGHSTTGIAVHRHHRTLATHSFEWGGFHITRDVAAGLRIAYEEAVELILEYGIPRDMIDASDAGEEEPAPAPEDQSMPIKLYSAVRGAPSIRERAELDMIVFERSQELMTSIRQYLNARGLDKHLVRGVVLTGGAAAIKNQAFLAAAVFQTPARLGLPEDIDVLPPPVNSPEFVPAVGVLRHGFEYRAAARSGRIDVRHGPVGMALRGVGGFLGKYFF